MLMRSANRSLPRLSKVKRRRDVLVARALKVGKLKLAESSDPHRTYWRWLLKRSMSDLTVRHWL